MNREEWRQELVNDAGAVKSWALANPIWAVGIAAFLVGFILGAILL